MIHKDILRDLIKNYFPEGNDQQITALCNELIRDLEVITHAKIRGIVSFERIGRLME